MRIIAVLLACVVASICEAQTFVGPLPYLSGADTPFDSSDPTYVLETFEDGLFNVAGVSASAGSVVDASQFGTLIDSVDGDDGVIDGNGNGGHSFFIGHGDAGITFTFDAAVLGGYPTNVGVVWTDGDGLTSFTAYGPNDVVLGSIGPVSLADGSFGGGTAEDRFFGVSHAGGIAKIKISNSAGGMEVDHLQFSFSGGACGGTADLNNDGHVNAADLAILLGAWGACAPTGCCAADLNASGDVNAADLATLLGAWTG